MSKENNQVNVDVEIFLDTMKYCGMIILCCLLGGLPVIIVFMALGDLILPLCLIILVAVFSYGIMVYITQSYRRGSWSTYGDDD